MMVLFLLSPIPASYPFEASVDTDRSWRGTGQQVPLLRALTLQAAALAGAQLVPELQG